MKKKYTAPELWMLPLAKEDILTSSGDNDAPFFDGGAGDPENEGWGNYY